MLISDPEAKPKIIVFPKKKGKFSHFRQYVALYLMLLITVSLAAWLGQRSINAYWQQTYHRASPLESLNRFGVWRCGENIREYLTGYYDDVNQKFNQQNQNWEKQWTTTTTEPIAASTVTTQVNATTAMTQASALENRQPEKEDEKAVYLQAGDKVLFAGDSIMQGIAPHLQKWLKSQYQIDSINLSKQSTGLAYPSFFDWPATIEHAFSQDKNLKLLIILIGANDPWDFPNPATDKGIPYLKFESDAWKHAYLARVNRIVQAAHQSQAKVIWLGIPYMKRPVLNTQMHYLEDILSQELSQKDNVLWLPINRLLSDGAENYQDSMVLDGETVQVRTKDGIHLTTRGQQFMADYIASYINYQENADSGSLKNP